MQQITKISLAWELFQEGIPQLHLAKQLGVDRVTVYRWIKGITTVGELELFKEADILLAPELTGRYGYYFLRQSMQRRFNSYVELIQTDGGSEFENEFKAHVLEYTRRHRIARPYKKNEQAYIESFNRSLRKECLGWMKYRQKDLPILTKEAEEYLEYYHKVRPHISWGMRPPLED